MNKNRDGFEKIVQFYHSIILGLDDRTFESFELPNEGELEVLW